MTFNGSCCCTLLSRACDNDTVPIINVFGGSSPGRGLEERNRLRSFEEARESLPECSVENESLVEVDFI